MESSPTLRVKACLLDATDLTRMLDRMARQILEYVEPAESPVKLVGLVGLQTRGVYLARRLAQNVEKIEGIRIPVGTLDVTLYRDDVHRRVHHLVRATHIPFDITDRHIFLVDDVLYTGRTARAALDALMDMGRPASVRLVIIVDRGHREIPVCADILGREIPTTSGEEVRVRVRELDGEEGVWLVEPIHQAERHD